MTHPGISQNEPLQFAMPQVLYDAFNQASHQRQGIGFEELAAQRPTDAYKMLTHTFERIAGSYATHVTLNDIEVSADMDGNEATHGFAKHGIEEVLTYDTDIEPIDVVVSVFQKPKFKDIIRGRKTESKQIVAFRVEPPNLAF